MGTACTELDTAARKSERAILQALASTGLAPIAEAAGVDESTVTRWKEKEIPRFCRTLAALNLKIVPRHLRCFDPKKIGAILALAKDHLAAIESTEQLSWDE